MPGSISSDKWEVGESLQLFLRAVDIRFGNNCREYSIVPVRVGKT